MESSDLASMTISSIIGNDRIFIYEVIIPSPRGLFLQHSLYRGSRFFWRVPYSQMRVVMRRINYLGGKIVRITAENQKMAVVGSNLSQIPWWLEIITTKPRCLYYFGPFDSMEEAKTHQAGYIEDLQAEGSLGISIQIKQCQPQNLTHEW